MDHLRELLKSGTPAADEDIACSSLVTIGITCAVQPEGHFVQWNATALAHSHINQAICAIRNIGQDGVLVSAFTKYPDPPVNGNGGLYAEIPLSGALEGMVVIEVKERDGTTHVCRARASF